MPRPAVAFVALADAWLPLLDGSGGSFAGCSLLVMVWSVTFQEPQ